jgi:RHS repeat-associated protein
MTVVGQALVYSYDNANRLTRITQTGVSGSTGIALGYDADSRRTSLTLPNGIVVNYNYDKASRLTGIVYQNGANLPNNLAYSYDGNGRRTQATGSFAGTNIPSPVGSATYDVGNHLTKWGVVSVTPDANGNILNDGVNTYSWDVRNQLAAISSTGVTSSFLYDAFGRRVNKTVGSTSTGLLYDGPNIVQELSGSTPTANLITGGLDEIFTRTVGTTQTSFLGDALGSTVALTGTSGAITTQYAYEPFGNTSSTGATSSSSYEFTGRENDATGLYFYRARYYSPRLQRFISEDPIGFAGGQINLNSYVGNDPVNRIDPMGTSDSWVHWLETYNAAIAVGYPVADAMQLANQVALADFSPGTQEPAAANAHGMGRSSGGKKGPQDPCEARAATADYVATADQVGALHAIEDSYVHQYAPWNGGWGGKLHLPGPVHAWHDLWYNDAAEAAAEAYLRTFGLTSNPAAYLAPAPNCK